MRGIISIVVAIVLFFSGLIWLADTVSKNHCIYLNHLTHQATKFSLGWPNTCLLKTKAGWVEARR